MTSNERQTLRFAVGSPNEYRSAVWHLSVQQNEVYLGSRFLGGLIKLSMHKSGIWRLAWEEKSGIKAQDSADRVEERWQRPGEFRPGWTQGPAVIVPHTGIARPFRHLQAPKLDKVKWARVPAPGNQLRFTILFASHSAHPDSWHEVMRPSDHTLGVLDLSNGDQIVLSERETAMAEKERSFVLPFVKGVRLNDFRQVHGASVFTAGTDDAGSPYVLDMALGWENVDGTAHPSRDVQVVRTDPSQDHG